MSTPNPAEDPVNTDDLVNDPAVFLGSGGEGEEDRAAIEQLVTDNMGLAIYLAQHWRASFEGRRFSQEDVEAVAVQGLVKAANVFDRNSGRKFGPYAAQTIRNYLNHHLHYAKKYATTELDVLDAPSSDDDDGTMHDRTAGHADVDDNAEVSDSKRVVREEISKLAEPFASILKLWADGKHLREIAPEVGMSHTMVGHNLKRGLEQLKKALVDKGITSAELLSNESASQLVQRRLSHARK